MRRHLHGCVLSTKQGFGALIGAKWASTLKHTAVKHDHHENQLFLNCFSVSVSVFHQEQEKRKVIKLVHTN